MGIDTLRNMLVLSCLGAAGGAAATDDAATVLEQVTVTATREEARLVETPASVGVVKGRASRWTSPHTRRR